MANEAEDKGGQEGEGAQAGAYLCPQCGADDWQADYYQAVNQGCTLKLGQDGVPYADDWKGNEDTYDDGCTEDELFSCLGCGYEIRMGEFRMVPASGCRGLVDEKGQVIEAHCERCAGCDEGGGRVLVEAEDPAGEEEEAERAAEGRDTGACPTCGSLSPWRCCCVEDEEEEDWDEEVDAATASRIRTCHQRVCTCHDPSAWTDPRSYPNGCSACGCRRAEEGDDA